MCKFLSSVKNYRDIKAQIGRLFFAFGYSALILANKFHIDLEMTEAIISQFRIKFGYRKPEAVFDEAELYSIYEFTDANHTHLQFRFRKRRADVIGLLSARFKERLDKIILKKRELVKKIDPFLKYCISDIDMECLKNSFRYTDWERLIQNRDKSTCQMCGYSEVSGKVKVSIYHIDEFEYFPEKRLDVNNGITLCKYCYQEMEPNWVEAKMGLKTIINGGSNG